VTSKKRTAREPLWKCRKKEMMSKPRGVCYCGTKIRRNLFTGGVASGMRGGLSLPKRRLSGTWELETPMRTEKSTDRRSLKSLSHSFTLDVIAHCRTERQAQEMRKAIAARLQSCGLELHPEKSSIARMILGRRLTQTKSLIFWATVCCRSTRIRSSS
jgi:hypothetical protein